MKLFATILLIGQVGTSGDLGSPPPVSGNAPPVQFDQAVGGQQPFRPTAQGPARPVAEVPAEAEVSPSRVVADAVGEPPAASPAPVPTGLLPAEPAPGNDRAAATAALPSTPQPAAQADPQAWQVAGSMMEQILVMEEQSASPLRRVRLIETLSRSGDPALSSAAIRTYWELVHGIAAARYATDKVRLLAEIPSPASDQDRALLAEALGAAEADETAAGDRLLARQYELLRLTGLPVEEGLPWPADAPLVAPYRTQFSTIYANRPAPLSLRQIHHRLPGKLSLIEKRVVAMSAAESAVDALHTAYQNNQSPLTTVLAAIERLDQSRNAFLAAVVDYNQQIAEYSLAVVGAGVGPETLVATLIKTPPAGALVDVPREVRQAAAAEPARGELRYR